MKQESAITSGFLSQPGTSRIMPPCVCKIWSLLAILIVLMLSMAAGDTSDARYNNLGHRMICMCDSEPASGLGQRGCKQVLLECTHANCNVSDRMRHELRTALQKGDNYDMILHSFVQNYGAEVLEQSSTTSNKLIWVVALAVLTSVVIAFARKWKSHPAIVATPPELSDVEVDVFRERVRRETENDDWE